MKTDNVSRTSPFTNIKPQQSIKKQSALTRLARFLGFSSIKVVPVTKYIPSSKGASQPSSNNEHTVVKLAAGFQGFRCNRKHLAMLEKELVKAPELQAGRSPENRRVKVKLAMVAAGMATLNKKRPYRSHSCATSYRCP